MTPRDAYQRGTLTSIDQISEEVLYRVAKTYENDPRLETKKAAMEFLLQFLTKDELQLLFFRFIQNNSYKTLKKTMNVGSTKTTSKYVKKIQAVIKSYMEYSMTCDYDKDIAVIESELGLDARRVAERMFRRESKNKIKTDKDFSISQNRLARTMLDIEILCLGRSDLLGFWKVIKDVGKLPVKKR